eukprot:gene17484-21384_t
MLDRILDAMLNLHAGEETARLVLFVLSAPWTHPKIAGRVWRRVEEDRCVHLLDPPVPSPQSFKSQTLALSSNALIPATLPHLLAMRRKGGSAYFHACEGIVESLLGARRTSDLLLPGTRLAMLNLSLYLFEGSIWVEEAETGEKDKESGVCNLVAWTRSQHDLVLMLSPLLYLLLLQIAVLVYDHHVRQDD